MVGGLFSETFDREMAGLKWKKDDDDDKRPNVTPSDPPNLAGTLTSDDSTTLYCLHPGEYPDGSSFTPSADSVRTVGDFGWLKQRRFAAVLRSWQMSLPWYFRDRDPSESCLVSGVDVERWRLATPALKRYDPDPFFISRSLVTPHLSLQSMTSSRAPHGGTGLNVLIPILLVPLLYGAPHLAGWNAHFPTTVERTMWRVASLVLCPGWTIALILLFLLYVILLPCLLPLIYCLSSLALQIIATLIISLPLLYVASSAFIVGESFRQLFNLPAAAYQVPSWSNYWPHFG